MQNGGLRLLYTNSDKILYNIGFQIHPDTSVYRLISTPIPLGFKILNNNFDNNFDKYTSTRNYIKIIEGQQNGEENCVPVLIYPTQPILERLHKKLNRLNRIPNEQDEPLYMYVQPDIGITYNYILLELLLKRLFVDLEDAESKLLTNTLNQFKKVYLIDVGNIGVKFQDIFNFLIVRCDRETKGNENLYLFFDKNPTNRPIQEENFEKLFIKYIKQIKQLDDIQAENYRNTKGKNMIMIRAFGVYHKSKKEINQVSTSNALDDFMFWLFALSINNIFDNNLDIKCDINDSKCFSTDLILISSDKQKINDPNGNKNLFTELKEINNFAIYVNGIQNIIITELSKFVAKYIVDSCAMNNCEPSKYKEEIGIQNAKSCLSESYNNDNNIDNNIDSDRLNRFWLLDNITPNDEKMLQNLKTVVESMNNLHPSFNVCNLFEKFMTLIRYLQYIYFNCADKIEKDKTKEKRKPYLTSKHPLPAIKIKPKCAMNDTIRLDFINDHY
jgi:hypothetical protein